MLIILFIHPYGRGYHITKHDCLSSQFWWLKFLALREFSLSLVISKNMHDHFQNMFNLRLCNSTTVRYSLSNFRFTLFCGIDSDYFQSHLCKCNSLGCIEATKRDDFLHDRPWISPWIKSISNQLDITIHVIASQFSCYCDVISNRLWRHQQKKDRASETRGRCLDIVVLSSFMDSLCRVRNKIMYVLEWRIVSSLTRVLFLCL